MTAPECTIPDCPRPCPDRAHLCPNHTRQLRQDLDRLGQLADDLPDTITRTARLGSRLEGAPSAETPLPWNEAAAAAGTKIYATLMQTARVIAARRDIPIAPHAGPACEHCTHPSCVRVRLLAQGGTPSGQLARWILHHVDWIRRQNDAAHFADIITGCMQVLEQAIERAMQRQFPVGPCRQPDDQNAACDGTLHATLRDTDLLLPAELTCDHCGFTLTALEWGRWARLTGRLKRHRTRAGKVVA